MDDHVLTADDIAVIEEFTTHAIRDEEDLWQRLQDTGARLAETLFLAAHYAPQSAGLTETVEDALGEWEALQNDIENESTRMNQRYEDAVETVEKGEQLMPFEREFLNAYKNNPEFRAATDQQRERESRGESSF